MSIFETLNAIGITPFHLQIGIITIIVAVLLAMYWKLITIGLGMIFCVYVFAMPSKIDANAEPVAKKIPVPLEYIEDCKRYTEKTTEECKQLWISERTEY